MRLLQFVVPRWLIKARQQQKRSRRMSFTVAPSPAESSCALTVRVLAPAQVDAATRAAWLALEARALEPNAYLSPHFVLPALEHLDPHNNALILLVQDTRHAQPHLVAAGVFEPLLGARHFPVPHLCAYRSRHTFLGGVLLDRACATAALRALLDYVQANPWRYQGIDFGLAWADGEQAQLLDEALRSHAAQALTATTVQRAVLPRASLGEAGLAAVPAARQQDMRRQWRRLNKQGATTWRAVHAPALAVPCAQTFLALENTGWKKEEGSAMACNAADTAFFYAVVQGFASEERMLFTELALDDRVIASTVNIISGDAAFAFKVGWDIAFKSFSPGLVNEWEFIAQGGQALPPHTRFIDSGASPGSYIEEFWPSRRPMANRVAATTAAGAAALGATEAARAFKRSAWLNLAVPMRDLSTALIAFV
jgi:CelD/BcsL family acetyltransferase involved in cellulose biosynthesis